MIPLALLGTIHGLVFGTNMDPKTEDVKKDNTPIVLIHGSGFNESQWIIGCQFFKGKDYGSVFSLSLDRHLFPNPDNGIEDYARMVKVKVDGIKKLTGRNDVILIGHSMGGLVGCYYKELFASETEIKKVISISTPWYGSPLLNMLTRLTKHAIPSIFKKPKRHCNMRNEEGVFDQLRERTVSDSAYYNIYSKGNALVPFRRGQLRVNLGHSKKYHFHGRFTSMISPGVWHQVQNWIKST